MAIAPNTRTIMDSPDLGQGQTRTGLSTQIVVMVGDRPVGAIQSFAQTQQRGTKPIAEVGTDGFIEIVPSSPTSISLTVSRIVFDGLSVTEAFSRGFMNISAQRMPFDIMVIDKFNGSDNKIVTIYKNCWFTNISKTFSAQDYVVSENASISVETVFSYKSTPGNPVGGKGHDLGDLEKDSVQTNSIEADTDVGVYRGSMAYEGIVNSQYD